MFANFLRVLFTFFAITSASFAIKAFDILPKDDSNVQKLRELAAHCEQAEELFSTQQDLARDSYSMAVFLAQLFHRLETTNERPNAKTIELLRDLTSSLSSELQLLSKDPEELNLYLESWSQTPLRAKAKHTKQQARAEPLRLSSLSVEGGGSNFEESGFSSFLDLTYHGFSQLEGYFKVGMESTTNEFRQNETRLNVEEASLNYAPKAFVDEVQLGKVRKSKGLGLAGDGKVSGLEVRKNYHDYEFEVGYYDGLFASVTSEFLLNIPITVYSMSSEGNQLERPGYHSGVYVKKEFNRLKLRSEASEFNQESSDQRNFEERGAFSVALDYEASSKLRLGTSLTHAGEKYRARSTTPSLEKKSLYQELSPGIQKEVLTSLSNYFGKQLNDLPGFSDFKVHMSLQASPKSKVELHFDRLYDHSAKDFNADNGFVLSSLYLDQVWDEKTTLHLSFQNLAWDRQGMGSFGLMRNVERQNFNLIRSSVRFKF